MRTQSSRTRKLVFTATGRFHVHTAVFMSITPFSRFSRLFRYIHGFFTSICTHFHVHILVFTAIYILFSRPHLVFTYTPSFSSSFGQTDFGRIFRVQMVCQVGPRTSNLEPRTSDLEPRTSNFGPRTSDIKPRTSNLEPRTSDLKPRTSNLGPRTSNLGPRTSNLEPWTSNLEPRTSNLGPRTSDLEPRTSNLGPRTLNLEPRTSNLEPRTTSNHLEPRFGWLWARATFEKQRHRRYGHELHHRFGHVCSMYRSSPFRSTLNTSYITGLTCVKYVPKQSIL